MYISTKKRDMCIVICWSEQHLLFLQFQIMSDHEYYKLLKFFWKTNILMIRITHFAHLFILYIIIYVSYEID